MHFEENQVKEELYTIPVNDGFDAGEKIFFELEVGVVDGFTLRDVSVKDG